MDKGLRNILTGDWRNAVKKLPKYQLKEIDKALKIHSKLMSFKFATISFRQLKKDLKGIIENPK